MKELRGIFPVLYTSFDESMEIDEEDLRRQVNYAIEQGTHGLVVNATDSESFKLNCEERQLTTEWVLNETHGRVPVVVGVSAGATTDSVKLTRHASEKGAIAVFSLPPLTGEITPQVIYAHFKTLNDAVNIPVMIQERLVPVPNTEIKHMVDELEHVRYIKEERPINAGQRITEILSLTDKMQVFSGGENVMNELHRGVIGVIPSCVGLAGYVKIFNNYMQGDLKTAWAEYERLLPLLTFRKQVNSILLTKEILRRKGIFKSIRTREPVGASLDELDLKMLDRLMERVGSPI